MQALILAAGLGKRLGELTQDRTKCLVRLHGVSLVERMIGQLSQHGIRHVTLVVGYFSDKVKATLGSCFAGVDIDYIENPIYETTNNIYSLFLAKEVLLREDTLLLESDIVMEDSVLGTILSDPRSDLALVAKCQPWMDGTVISLDEEDRITGFFSKGQPRQGLGNSYKTINIYKFSREFSQTHYVPFLTAYCKAMGRNEYYEQVLRVITLLERPTLRALRLGSEKWYEIDDIQDLAIAETLFAPDDMALNAFASRYGGYWRFPNLVDFCYLVNPFFPNTNLVEELRSFFPTLLSHYPSGSGVQRHLAGRMFGIPPDQIIVGNGAAELIEALQSSYSGITGVVRPSFDEFANRTTKGSLRIFEPEGFSYSVEDLLAFVSQECVDRLILVNPDNPTGHNFSLSEVEWLVSSLDELGCELVLDESFADFASPSERFSLLSSNYLARHHNLIVIKSISKSYGVPGLRLGVAASFRRSTVEAMASRLPIWNINSFAEFFLQVIGKYGQDYREACDRLSEERARFAKVLDETGVLKPLPSSANFLFCEVLRPFTPGGLAKALLVDHGILVKNCSTKPGVQDRPFIRIAVRTPQENECFAKAVQSVLIPMG